MSILWLTIEYIAISFFVCHLIAGYRLKVMIVTGIGDTELPTEIRYHDLVKDTRMSEIVKESSDSPVINVDG